MNIKKFYAPGTNKPFRLNGIDGYASRGYTESAIGGESFAVNDIIRLGDTILQGYSLDDFSYVIPKLGGVCRGKLCYVEEKQTGSTPTIYLTMITGIGASADHGSNRPTNYPSVAGDTLRGSTTGSRTCGGPVKRPVYPALVITAAHAAGSTIGTNSVAANAVIQFGDIVSWTPSMFRN